MRFKHVHDDFKGPLVVRMESCQYIILNRLISSYLARSIKFHYLLFYSNLQVYFLNVFEKILHSETLFKLYA